MDTRQTGRFNREAMQKDETGLMSVKGKIMCAVVKTRPTQKERKRKTLKTGGWQQSWIPSEGQAGGNNSDEGSLNSLRNKNDYG